MGELLEFLSSILRLSTPVLFAAAGGLLCERTGIATICLEGVMLLAAWSAAVVTYYSHNPYLGLMVGVFSGMFAMGIHAFLTLYGRSDHIISGVAVNLFAAGLTPLLSKTLFASPTSTPSLPLEERFDSLPLVVGSLLVLFVVHLVFYKTRWGLWIRSAGDAPEALETAGVKTRRVRLAAMLTGGAIAGLGGIFLSIAHASQFTRDMTAGRGFIALTAVIFGKWKPIPAFFACLLLGIADALQIQLQGTTWNGVAFPVQFIQALPYVVTLVVLAGFVGRANAPTVLGKRLT